jgi:hypothetical protein
MLISLALNYDDSLTFSPIKWKTVKLDTEIFYNLHLTWKSFPKPNVLIQKSREGCLGTPDKELPDVSLA